MRCLILTVQTVVTSPSTRLHARVKAHLHTQGTVSLGPPLNNHLLNEVSSTAGAFSRVAYSDWEPARHATTPFQANALHHEAGTSLRLGSPLYA